METPLFEARMSSVGNPDYGQYAPVSEPCHLTAATLPELLAKIEAYRDENDLGCGNWVDPKVICGMKTIGWVSYNMRLWDRSDRNPGTPVEIKPERVVGETGKKQPPPIDGDTCDRIRRMALGEHGLGHTIQYGSLEPNLIATGRARCRCCGMKIPKGEKEHRFYWDFHGSGSWTAVECHIHAAPCESTKVH